MSARRVFLIGQCTLATSLTLLWLWWNPLSPECGSGGIECGVSFVPFETAVREEAPETHATQEASVADAPVTVEYGRCDTVMARADGSLECIYDPDEPLYLWVAHPRPDELVLEVDGQPLWPQSYGERGELGEGFVVTLLGDDARRLSVRFDGEERWTLPLRATTRLTDDERSALARFEQRAYELELDLRLGHLERLPYTRELVNDMFAGGFFGKAVEEVLIASYQLTQQPGRPELAEALIEQLPAMEAYPWGQAAASIYRGNALLEQGRLVEAATAYRDGSRFAVRMHDPGLQIDGLSNYSRVLAELGYYVAAVDWGMQVVNVAKAEGRPADVVSALITVAWANLRLREAGVTHGDPGLLLREALEVPAHVEPDTDVGELDPGRLGLAKLAILDGEPARSLRWLDEIDETTLTADQLVEARDVRLQALLAARGASGRAEIRRALAGLEAAAEHAIAPAARWQALVRKGVVLEEEGDLAGAQAAYERAEALVDRVIALGWLGVSAGGDAAGYSESIERLVSVLLRQGRAERALCAARRAQARRSRLALSFRRIDPAARDELRPVVERYREAMRMLGPPHGGGGVMLGNRRRSAHARELVNELDRRVFELVFAAAAPAAGQGEPASCGALGTRASGELILALYPHIGDIIVFAQDDDGTTHQVLTKREAGVGDDSWPLLGALILDSLGSRLRRAARVRALAAGRAAEIPVHALPWRGRPLALQVPVVYGLELPTVTPLESPGTSPRALVLEDPDASSARFEATEIARTLRSAGWVVRGHQSTTSSVAGLLEQLGAVDHFHYAGHAGFGEDQHQSRWPPRPGGAVAEASFIPVSDGELAVQDVLMMRQAPRTAVLMGCNTGVQDERMAHGGFSLATGFVAAGSVAVVASTRRVLGAEASLMGRGLHEVMAADGSVRDPGEWFRKGLVWAQRHGLSERAMGDYRVFVP